MSSVGSSESLIEGSKPRKIEVFTFPSWANPVNPKEHDEYFSDRRKTMGWKFDMVYGGRFVKPAGTIYGDAFSETENVISRAAFEELCQGPDIPFQWPRDIGIDFGNVNTAGVVLARACAKTPTHHAKDGWVWGKPVRKWYLFRSYHNGRLEPGNLTERASEAVDREQRCRHHAQQLLKAAGSTAKLRAAGGAPAEDGWREAYQLGGLLVHEPLQKNVEVGIQMVYTLFVKRELMIVEDCVEVLDEITNYSRELDDEQDPTDTIKNKQKFHRLDGLRAIATHIGEDIEPKEDTKEKPPQPGTYAYYERLEELYSR